MQSDVERVENWRRGNKIEINTSKTPFNKYTRKINNYVSDYSFKDLSVTFYNNLNINVHLEIITVLKMRKY